jgi:hypothetical protein
MSYWGRIAVVLTLALALFVTANLLGASIDTLLASCGLQLSPAPEAPKQLPCSPESSLGDAQRQVKILADPQGLTIQLNLTLPVAASCVSEAFSGELSPSLDGFVRATFGSVLLAGQRPKAGDLTLSTFREPGEPTALVRIERRIPLDRAANVYASSYGQNTEPASDELQVILQPGVRVQSIRPVPDVRTPEMLIIRRLRQRIGYFDITLERSSETAGPSEPGGTPSPPAAPPRRETRQEFLAQVGDIDPWPVLAHLLSSLHFVLPLLIALLWMRKAEDLPSTVALFDATTKAMLLFYSSYYVLGSLNAIAGSKLFSRVARSATQWIQDDLHLKPFYDWGFSIAYSAILGIGVPILIKAVVKPPDKKTPMRGPWLAWKVLLLVAAVFLTAGAGAVLRNSARPGIGVVLLVLGNSLVLFACLLAVIFQKAPGAAPSALAPVCALATVFLQALDSFFHDLPGIKAFWLILGCVLGAFLVRSLAGVFSIAAQTFVQRPRWADRRDVRLAAVFALLLIALPLPSLSLKDLDFVNSHSVGYLAFFLLPWVLPIWLTGSLVLLFKEGRDRLELSHAAHALGLLALSTALFSPRIYWFYLPVTFLLGWLTLDRILVQEQPPGSISGLREILLQKRSLLFEGILDRNAADQAVRSHRRKKLEDLLAGKLEFEDYERECDDRAAMAESVRQRALAPHATAWENGLHGALFGAVFGLPWIAFGLASLLRYPMIHSPHPLLDLGSDVVLLILRWVVAGFLLGYFYPYLRGRSGLMKGFYLFLALTLPTIPFGILQHTTAGQWQPTLFLYRETFIHCMLLGLFAFDFAVLRLAGFKDWRLLFELHGLPALGISLSSLAVAIGAAITTLLSSQLSSLVGAALRVALPAAPELPR